MKYILGLLMLMFLNITARSQIYLGYTQRAVLAKIKPTESAIKTVANTGDSVLEVKYKHPTNAYIRFYYFKKGTGLCHLYVVEPLTRAAQAKLAEVCNEDYSVINNRRWRHYMGNLTIRIDLVYMEDLEKNVFMYNIETEDYP